METLQLKKLSQAIKNIRNKVKIISSLTVYGLDEDEIDGLTAILSDVGDELEQAANTIELLKPSDYAMKKRGRFLQAVNTVKMPDNGSGIANITA